MDKRFFNIFGLTEDQALSILETPFEQLKDQTDHYVAVAHLINFPSQESINALIKVVHNQESDLYNRITKRKALESLGRLQAVSSLPVICSCLNDEDSYTVENAVWAIGEIGTQDQNILETIAQLLEKPNQSYRVIIQTLAKLNYSLAIEKIEKFIESDDPSIASAAISAVCALKQDYSQMSKIVEFLQHENVNARRGSIQDLIDAQYYDAIPNIARTPVSIVFRLRGIKTLATLGIAAQKINFSDIESYLDQVIKDHPNDLELVHEYDQQPSLDFLISELYHTDFGRCYLATKTLLDLYSQESPAALLKAWDQGAHNDYGANYHVIKLLGWLKYAPATDLLVVALQNPAPHFQKSRVAAAIGLGCLGDKQAIPWLHEVLNTQIFELKYASLLALAMLGDEAGKEIVSNDSDELIKAKAKT